MTKRSKKPARTRLEVDERREQLIALGLRIFSDAPYDEVSLEAIAAQAGVSKGLLFHYFSSKRGYYIACLEEAAQELLRRTTSDPAQLPLEQLRSGINAYLDYVSVRGPAFVALMRGGVGSDPAVAAIVDHARQELVQRLTAGVPLGNPPPPVVQAALRGWVGFAETVSLQWLEHRNFSREELLELLIAMLEHTVATAVSCTAGSKAEVQ